LLSASIYPVGAGGSAIRPSIGAVQVSFQQEEHVVPRMRHQLLACLYHPLLQIVSDQLSIRLGSASPAKDCPGRRPARRYTARSGTVSSIAKNT
jgi:hypothetical protein